MPTLQSHLNVTGNEFLANRTHNEGLLELLNEQLRMARVGGGSKYQERHKKRA